MSEFLDWKILDQAQVQMLETETDMNNLRRCKQRFYLQKWHALGNYRRSEDLLINSSLLNIFAYHYTSASWRITWKYLLTAKRNEKSLLIFISTTTCKILYLAFWFDETNRNIIIFDTFWTTIRLRFCKEQAFDHRRTSTFMCIMAEILKCDAAAYSPAHTRAISFQGFQKLLLKHSIQRSPRRYAWLAAY